VEAHRHERVLQRPAAAGVGVHVAGGHARHPQPSRQFLQAAVAGAVLAQERTLQFDAQPLRSECVQQPAQGRLIMHSAQGAAAQADQPLGVIEHGRQRDRRVGGGRARTAFACVCVRSGEDPAEVGPSARV
jgi:hypothetical protein